MDNYNYFSNTNYDVRVPFLLIEIGNYNLTPVPQKYLKSFTCKRLENESAGSFTMDLVSPINAFDKGQNDEFATIIEYLMSLTLSASNISGNDDETSKINIIYGWQNGAKNLIKDGEISACSFNADAQNINLLTCHIEGVTPTVFTNCFSKNMYEKFTSTASTEESVDTSDPEAVQKYQQDVNAGIDEQSLTILSAKQPAISYIIETLANYLFGDYYDVEVDHVDKIYYDGKTISSIISSSTNLDMSSMTLWEYLKKLVENCKEEITLDTLYNYKESNVRTITISGKTYIPTADVAYKFADYDEQAFQDLFADYDIVSGREGVLPTSIIENGAQVYGRYIKTQSGETYTFREVTQGDLSADSITGGESTLNYKMVFGKQSSNNATKPKLKIGPASNEDAIATFTIDNNIRDNEVISFSISSDALAGISAISSLDSGSTSDIDVSSGSPILVDTDLGGLIPLSEIDAEILKDNFIAKLSEMVAEDTSEATMTVFASTKSNYIDLIDTIRVYPMVNSTKTFWCGDYDIFEIDDTVDSEGFKTTFKMNFKKCTVYSTLKRKASDITLLKYASIDAMKPHVKGR